MTERVPSHATIEVGGLTFNATDDLGVMWLVETIKGWHDGPSVSFEQTPRLVDHGVFGSPGRRGGRTVTLAGSIFGQNRTDVGEAVDRLAALLADGGYGRFEFHDDNQGTRWTDVQIAATPDIEWLTATDVEYQVQLFSPSAIKYGQKAVGSTGFAETPYGVGLRFPMFLPGHLDFGEKMPSIGSVTLRNHGTAPGTPVFTVTGPTPSAGFVITDIGTGRRIRYFGTIPVGSALTIDARRGVVLLNGVADRSYEAVIDGWPTVPPRTTRDFLFESLGAHATAILSAEMDAPYW